MQPARLLISRTDSLGDVVLTLPMLRLIKQKYPQAEIYFLGRCYTEELILLNKNISGFISLDRLTSLSEQQQVEYIKSFHFDTVIHVFPVKDILRLAKQAKIKNRIATAGRLSAQLYCNHTVRFSRKNSTLHEAQLNLKLLSPLGIKNIPSLCELSNYYDVHPVDVSLPSGVEALLNNKKINLIFHPKSRGSAVEWAEERYLELIERLPPDQFEIFVSGTAEEAELAPQLATITRPNVHSLFGTLTLKQFIKLISLCDGLIASSTGPLHIAAAYKKIAIGLYSARRPIHPGRWQPVGYQSHYLVYDECCERCQSDKDCDCINRISADKVKNLLYGSLDFHARAS